MDNFQETIDTNSDVTTISLFRGSTASASTETQGTESPTKGLSSEIKKNLELTTENPP